SVGSLAEAEGLLNSVAKELKAQGSIRWFAWVVLVMRGVETLALRSIDLEPNKSAHYGHYCSMYAAVGRYEETHKSEEQRKEMGSSSLDVVLVNLNEIVGDLMVRERQPENQELKLGCRENEKDKSGMKIC
ncbi:hypothetical protein EJB05_34497, partial [Eragrostis curvula]